MRLFAISVIKRLCYVAIKGSHTHPSACKKCDLTIRLHVPLHSITVVLSLHNDSLDVLTIFFVLFFWSIIIIIIIYVVILVLFSTA